MEAGFDGGCGNAEEKGQQKKTCPLSLALPLRSLRLCVIIFLKLPGREKDFR